MLISKTFTILAMTALLVTSAAYADDSHSHATLRFQASDFPALARGIRVPRDGRYTITTWGPRCRRWTANLDGDTLRLAIREEGDDMTPHFQKAGEVTLRANRRLEIVVDSANPKKTPHPPSPVPAMLVLSTDPRVDPSPALDLVRSRVDSVAPPPDPRRTRIRTLDDGAGFRPPSTLEAWEARARALREQILVTLGLWPTLAKTPLHPQVHGKVGRDGYTIEKVLLETFPGFILAGNVYRPTGKPGRLPAMLCPHGHAAEGRADVDVQHRCIRWAKLGCVVFTYDMVGFADSKPFGHAFLNDRLRRWGLSLATLQTWNSIRALDWITSLPDVDPARVGCTGESGGGTQTFLLAAIDDRVKITAPVVMVSDKMQGGSPCENAAGLRIGTDNVEIAALTAPRPMKLIGATGDWTAATMSDAFPKIRDVYSLYGMPDRVAAEVFDFPHNYNQTSRNAVYPFMARWLLGIEDSAATKEGPQVPEKPEVLYAFDPSHPAPASLKTPAQLESYLIEAIAKEIQVMGPSHGPSAWEAASRLLKTIHRIRIAIANPGAGEIDQFDVRTVRRPRLIATHHLVGRKSTGERIAVIRFLPSRPTSRLTVISAERGKDDLIASDGSPIPLVRRLLERGQTVIGFDPIFVGESVDSMAPATRRPDTEHFDTYNPALATDQMQDLATVIAWASALPKIHEVNIIARGAAGPQALAVRPLLTGVARTVIDMDHFDAGDASGTFPPAFDIPGIFQFGGFEMAAAFCSPEPLWIHSTGPKFNTTWATQSFALADSIHLLRINTGRIEPDKLVRWIDSGD